MKLKDPRIKLIKEASTQMKWAVERIEDNDELCDEILELVNLSGIEVPSGKIHAGLDLEFSRDSITLKVEGVNAFDDDFAKALLRLLYDAGFRNHRTADDPSWRSRTHHFQKEILSDGKTDSRRLRVALNFRLDKEATGCELVQVDTKTREVPIYKFDCGEEPIFDPEPKAPPEKEDPKEDNSLSEEVEVEEKITEALEEYDFHEEALKDFTEEYPPDEPEEEYETSNELEEGELGGPLPEDEEDDGGVNMRDV